MPELPEVQTVINGLREKVSGKNIKLIKELRKGTVIWHTEADTIGRITKIDRRGKYIIIHTDMDYKIVIHLRMTGKLIFETDYKLTAKHTRAEIKFSDQTKLIFNDVRTFGKIEIFLKDQPVKGIENLGVEPLSEEFNFSYLKEKIKNRKAPIKNILLDQSVVAGLGNIYVCEILFRTGISPTREGRKLTGRQIKSIVAETKIVLEEALKNNGTTISDYRNVDDKSGEFQNFLRVYGKEKCNCGSDITRIKQAGRSTYYCRQCQR